MKVTKSLNVVYYLKQNVWCVFTWSKPRNWAPETTILQVIHISLSGAITKLIMKEIIISLTNQIQSLINIMILKLFFQDVLQLWLTSMIGIRYLVMIWSERHSLILKIDISVCSGRLWERNQSNADKSITNLALWVKDLFIFGLRSIHWIFQAI